MATQENQAVINKKKLLETVLLKSWEAFLMNKKPPYNISYPSFRFTWIY